MRVLVVTNDLPPRVGGIQYYVDQLGRGLVSAGDEVVLLGSSSEGADAFDRTAPYEVVRERTPVLLPTPTVARHATRLVEAVASSELSWVVGVQWHPEWLDGSELGGPHRSSGDPLFERFVSVCRERAG